MRIALVACAKSKLNVPSRAEDLYISPLFSGMRMYAERNADRWYILSAKHGVLRPNRVVAPYDKTLSRMTKAERVQWASRVNRQLARLLPPRTRVILLAGLKYRVDLEPFLKQRHLTVEIPFKGLSIGMQLQRLKRFRLEVASRRQRGSARRPARR
jgi:hypothetical protein